MSTQLPTQTSIRSSITQIAINTSAPNFHWERHLHKSIEKAMPLPDNTVYFGVSKNDQQPVLINTQSTKPGTVLVGGEPQSGKTALLQIIAAAITYAHPPSDIQFAVITSRAWNWKPSLNCMGIFDPQQTETNKLLSALASWIRQPKCTHTTFLLIDNLEEIVNFQTQQMKLLRDILYMGPSKRIYSVVTTSSEMALMHPVSEHNIRTHIFCTPGGKNNIYECEYLLKGEIGWLIFSPFA